MNDSSSNASILDALFRSWHQYGVQSTAVLAVLILGVALYMAVIETPLFRADEFGALASKIMFLHIPFAFVSFVAFFFGCVSATVFLIYGKKNYDDYSFACVEVGFFFSLGVLISGPLWAYPVWGVFWNFEPRLNTFLIMWCMYASYFLIPPFMDGREVKENFRSVMAILGFLMVPVVYFSVDMVAAEFQNHPQRGLEMATSMKWTIGLVMVALFLLFLCLSWTRYRVLRLQRKLYRRMIGARE